MAEKTAKANQCQVCQALISGRNYRKIASMPHLIAVLNEIMDVDSVNGDFLICSPCVNKLIKIEKIDQQLSSRMESLKQERTVLVTSLRENIPVPRTPKKTPTKSKKRLILHTPTPKSKLKVQRGQMFGDESSRVPLQVRPVPMQTDEVGKDVRTDDPGTVKITVAYPSQTKTRIVKDPTLKTALKGIVDGSTNIMHAVATSLYKDKKFREKVHDLTVRTLSKECKELSSTRKASVLQNKSVDALKSIHWEEVVAEWKRSSNLMFMVLSSITSSRPTVASSLYSYIGLAGAVLLFRRNPKMCRLQYEIGLLLDQSGTTDEAINVLQKMGVSVTPQSLAKKKKEMLKEHKNLMEDMVGNYKKQRALQSSAETYLQQMEASTFPPIVQVVPTPSPSESVPLVASKPIGLNKLDHVDSYSWPQKTLPCPKDAKKYTVCASDCQVVVSAVEREANESDMDTDLTCELAGGKSLGHSSDGLVYTVASDLTTSIYQKQLLDSTDKSVAPVEVYGDNFDVTVNPSAMTVDKQRQSWHWFLVLAGKKRWVAQNLPNDVPKAQISTVHPLSWFLSNEEWSSYENNVDFHLAQIMCGHVKFLKPIMKYLPKYIDHPYIELSSKKSDILNVELIEASENSSEGMMQIMKRLNETFVPKLSDEKPDVIDRVVLGGDVLTNERAFSAQEGLSNVKNESAACSAFVHRPEGLHREMNLLSEIYKEWYKKPVGGKDRALLYDLRSILNRRDVQGHENVTKSFRSHEAFIIDALEAFVVAEAMLHFQMNTMDDEPEVNKPPATEDPAEIRRWILTQARTVKENLMKTDSTGSVALQAKLSEMCDVQSNVDMCLTDNGNYVCLICNAKYKRRKNFAKHLQAKHYITLDTKKTEEPCTGSTKQDVIGAFCKMAFLYVDLTDAFKMGDADRIFRDAKLEMIYAFSMGHSKYRLWLWRMLSYEIALLTAKEAFEYKWNITSNLSGGIGHNIPNDNVVEIQVGEIKKRLQAQGSNKSFQSAQVLCKTNQIIEKIKKNLQKETGSYVSSRKRTSTSKAKDIGIMVSEILNARVLESEDAGSEYETFPNYKDPLSRIKIEDLYLWLNDQKFMAAKSHMVREVHRK